MTTVKLTFTAAVLLALAATQADAAILLTWFPASDYNSNTSAMNATLGITGDTIDTFETTTLIPGLTITLSGGVTTTTWTSLPNLNNSTSLSCNIGAWDGTDVASNEIANQLSSCSQSTGFAGLTTFAYAPGTTSFGIGLGNFQSLTSPSNPITNHELFVNGGDMGTIENLDPTWTPGIALNAYLVITASGGSSITSVGFENLTAADYLTFDHLAVAGTTSSAPEPGTLSLICLGALAIGLARRWKVRGVSLL